MPAKPTQLMNTGHSWLQPKAYTEAPYGYQEFPKMMHHKTEAPITVLNAKDQANLGPGWKESPAEFAAELAREKADAEKADAAKAKAEAEKAKAEADKAKK